MQKRYARTCNFEMCSPSAKLGGHIFACFAHADLDCMYGIVNEMFLHNFAYFFLHNFHGMFIFPGLAYFLHICLHFAQLFITMLRSASIIGSFGADGRVCSLQQEWSTADFLGSALATADSLQGSYLAPLRHPTGARAGPGAWAGLTTTVTEQCPTRDWAN